MVTLSDNRELKVVRFDGITECRLLAEPGLLTGVLKASDTVVRTDS